MPRITSDNNDYKPSLDYNERLSPAITLGLGREQAVFSLQDASRHVGVPGLVNATYTDIITKQVRLRPVISADILLRMGFTSGG